MFPIREHWIFKPNLDFFRYVGISSNTKVKPDEICVIQRGITFSVRLPDGEGAGYIAEV